MITARIKPRPRLKVVITRPGQGKGYADGYEDGHRDGTDAGYKNGYEDGTKNAIASLPKAEEVAF